MLVSILKSSAPGVAFVDRTSKSRQNKVAEKLMQLNQRKSLLRVR
ncbi:hypothetical protein [Bdellovibrio bacteriovorus]